MRGEPSPQLVDLLARLKLASAEDLRSVASRARRLAGELPDFDSVWVDALASARILTPYQAAEINAGRGDSLLRGSYVISRPLPSVYYAACFEARHLDHGRAVRLHVVARPQSGAAAAVRTLTALVEQSKPLAGPVAAVVEDAGMSGQGVWAACPIVQGVTAADWMAENGRFSPDAVWHIAREMVARLSDLELLGISHGDVGAAGLLLHSTGHVGLPMPGVRGIVRSCEGYGLADLAPEGYDYLAPERIADGGPPTIAGDLYACGCLWWHLLTGRPPFPGGNSLAKLKAVHAAKVVDVRQLAPNVPDALARAIEACLAREPALRPQSFVELAGQMGAPTRAGAALLSRVLARRTPAWQLTIRVRGRHAAGSKRFPVAAIAAAVLMLGATASWPLWRARFAPRPGDVAAVKRMPPADAGAKKLVSASEKKRIPPLDHSLERPSPVKLATATLPVTSKPADDLVLSGTQRILASELALKAGHHVHGRGGHRPLVAVPPAGLVVACEDVCFDGVDFVWDAEATTKQPAIRPAAMLIVKAQSVEFRGCSFSTGPVTGPVAIAWTGGPTTEEVAAKISVADCVFYGVDSVVDCQAEGKLSVSLTNSLCVAAGPIVRLHRAPRSGQVVAISLERTTTRGDSAVLEVRYARAEDAPGSITISAIDSVFDANPQGALLIFSGPRPPQKLAAGIAWSGQGSLVTPHTAVALWRPPGRKPQVLPEDDLEVAGLVRSSVEFAGPAEGPPAGSRMTRWQGPLRSVDPPGANAAGLHRPRN